MRNGNASQFKAPSGLLVAVVGLGICLLPSVTRATGWVLDVDNIVYETGYSNNGGAGYDDGEVDNTPYEEADNRIGYSGSLWANSSAHISSNNRYSAPAATVYGGGTWSWTGPGSPTPVTVGEHLAFTVFTQSYCYMTSGSTAEGYADVGFGLSADGFSSLSVGESGVETSFGNHPTTGYYLVTPGVSTVWQSNNFGNHTYPSFKDASGQVSYRIELEDNYTPSGSVTSLNATYWIHAESVASAYSNDVFCQFDETAQWEGSLYFSL